MTASEADRVIAALSTQNAVLSEQIMQVRRSHEAALKDSKEIHEKFDSRITALERARWLLTGVFLAGGGVGATLAKFLG